MARGFKTGGRTVASQTEDAANLRLQKKARRHADAAIRELAAQIKTGSKQSDRRAAAEAILDRAFGKPGQTTTHAGGVTLNVKLEGTDKDL